MNGTFPMSNKYMPTSFALTIKVVTRGRDVLRPRQVETVHFRREPIYVKGR